MCWYLSLQPFAFKEQHRAGRENTNADALYPTGEGSLPSPGDWELGLRRGVCNEEVCLPSVVDTKGPTHTTWWAEMGASQPACQKPRVGTGRGSIKTRPCSIVRGEPQEEEDYTLLLWEWEVGADPCCTTDWLDLLEMPDHVDAEELLRLPLAVYPGETEDNLMLQVHYRGCRK